MGKTTIGWTDMSWNPVRGCTRVSEGCRNCYAERIAARFSGEGQPYEGLARQTPSGPRWTGEVRVVEEHMDDPTRWRKPRMVFVNSMSDLFHEGLCDRDIGRVFRVMEGNPRHTFQVLTKRPERVSRWWNEYNQDWFLSWPSNVWIGTSIEDQATADERIPHLLRVPAATRFLSVEPLLGSVDLKDALGLTWERCDVCSERYSDVYWADDGQWKQVVGDTYAGLRCPTCFKRAVLARDLIPKLETLQPPLRRPDWVIVGGESGPGARPMRADWVQSLRDQCVAGRVPFFFKQWGGVNKKRSGRELDGRTWDEMPETK